MNELDDSQRNAIQTEICSGRRIQAIKLYREATHAGLAEAKDAVEAMEAQLRVSDPTRFKAQPSRGCAPVLLLAISAIVVFAWLQAR